MKKMKKIFAMLIAMVMVLGMSTIVFADDPTGSIEITSPVTDPNADKTYYDAYKIMDMTTNGATDATTGDYTAVAYTINSAWEGFFATGAAGAGYIVDTNSGNLNPIVVNGATKYINITDSNVAEFAKAAFDYAQKNNISATKTVEVAKGATTVKFEDLALGYYMIYPRGASVRSGSYTSIVSISNTAPNGKVDQKAEWPDLDKTADDVSVEVGQKVTYTLSSKVPDTTGYNKYEMTFADTTTAGLTFDGIDSITVKIGSTTLTRNTDYTVSTDPADFTLTIDMLKADKTAKYTYDDPITVTYTATVNESAITKIDKNKATLTYHNNPKNSDDKETTPPEEVKTFSSKIIINKVDGDDKTKPLGGAKFVLKAKAVGSASGDSHESDLAVGKYYYYDSNAKDVKWIEVPAADQTAEKLATNQNITVAVTESNGVADVFKGLENGVYELIEVEAPAGYNLVTTPKEVTINGNDAEETSLTITSEVENKSGTQLPSTGGIGTTIFYAIGAVLVIGAGIVLVTRRRMNAQ